MHHIFLHQLRRELSLAGPLCARACACCSFSPISHSAPRPSRYCRRAPFDTARTTPCNSWLAAVAELRSPRGPRSWTRGCRWRCCSLTGPSVKHVAPRVCALLSRQLGLPGVLRDALVRPLALRTSLSAFFASPVGTARPERISYGCRLGVKRGQRRDTSVAGRDSGREETDSRAFGLGRSLQ